MEIRTDNKLKMVVYFLLFFVIARPGYISYITSDSRIKTVFTVIEMAAYVYIMIMWLFNRRISSMLIMALFMYGIIILSTFMHGGSVYEALRENMRFVFMVMLADNEKDDIDGLWRICIIYLSLMIVLNFISILAFPNGMYDSSSILNGQRIGTQKMYFFGAQNTIGKYIIPLLFFMADSDFRNKERLGIGFYIMSVIGIISLVMMEALTPLMAVIIMILMLICSPWIRNFKPRIFNIYLLIGIIAVFFVLFVILNSTGAMSSFFIKDVLGATTTFNGRTPIWTRIIERIAAKPILGYGYMSQIDFRVFSGLLVASDAHNYLLTIGIYGGLIAMGTFLIIILSTAGSIRTRQFDYPGITLTAFMFALLIMMMFEDVTIKFNWIILGYAFWIRSEDIRENEVIRWRFYHA